MSSMFVSNISQQLIIFTIVYISVAFAVLLYSNLLLMKIFIEYLLRYRHEDSNDMLVSQMYRISQIYHVARHLSVIKN